MHDSSMNRNSLSFFYSSYKMDSEEIYGFWSPNKKQVIPRIEKERRQRNYQTRNSCIGNGKIYISISMSIFLDIYLSLYLDEYFNIFPSLL